MRRLVAILGHKVLVLLMDLLSFSKSCLESGDFISELFVFSVARLDELGLSLVRLLHIKQSLALFLQIAALLFKFVSLITLNSHDMVIQLAIILPFSLQLKLLVPEGLFERSQLLIITLSLNRCLLLKRHSLQLLSESQALFDINSELNFNFLGFTQSDISFQLLDESILLLNLKFQIPSISL